MVDLVAYIDISGRSYNFFGTRVLTCAVSWPALFLCSGGAAGVGKADPGGLPDPQRVVHRLLVPAQHGLHRHPQVASHVAFLINYCDPGDSSGINFVTGLHSAVIFNSLSLQRFFLN